MYTGDVIKAFFPSYFLAMFLSEADNWVRVEGLRRYYNVTDQVSALPP